MNSLPGAENPAENDEESVEMDNDANRPTKHDLKRIKVSNDDRERIVAKTLEGYSVSSIAAMYSKKYQTVNTIVKKYLKTGMILPKKRGGDRRSILSLEIKKQLLAYVDQECTRTLKQLSAWVKETFDIAVSLSTIDRALRQFHYTLKGVTLVPERRICESTVELRKLYSATFRELEVNEDDKNIVFLDEVGFSVVTRPRRGRSRGGQSAYVTVPAARSRNISVVAAMNKYGMIFHKINERAVNGEDFKEALKELKVACASEGIEHPILIMDNARIHHYRGLENDHEVSCLAKKYLPPYSPFLNPIENVFSVWKNLVIRGGARNEVELRNLINAKFAEVTTEHCGSFYRKMLGYLIKCANGEEILE